jgi:hypothetical protein
MTNVEPQHEEHQQARVVPVTGGAPVTDGFEAWFKRAAHQIESLMAVTNLAQNALISGMTAVQAAVETVGSAAIDGQRWLRSDPCPDAELGDRFGRLFERYSAVATGFEEGYQGRGMEYLPALTQEVGALSGDLTDFIADVQKRLGG